MSTNVCGLRSTSGNQLDLHLHHDPMAGAERVVDVLHGERYRRRLARRERLRLLEAVAELAAHHVAAHQLLIAAHAHAGRVRVRIGIIVGIDVDQLHDPVGIGARSSRRAARPGSGRRWSRPRRARRSGRPARRAGEPAKRWSAIMYSAAHADGDLVDVRHRLGRIAEVFVEALAPSLGRRRSTTAGRRRENRAT